MTETARPGGAVFLSYAREDGEAARRIAEALRGFGIEVWFDLSELRGGDAWDQQIRRQIKECTLFVPIVSAHTQARDEGYFRREWRLAVDRTHDMAENRAFLVPVIIDDTREADANVPEQFLKAHFTRLRGGEPTPLFVEQVKRLLQPAGARAAGARSASTAPATPAKARFPVAIVALGFVIAGLVAFIFVRPAAKPDPVSPANSAPPPAVPAKPAESVAAPAVAVAAKSIAVLPFVDMSQAKDQEFFSDGLSEELLNLLAKVPGLQVTSRSSAFSYKGKELKLSQVAQELRVAHILEGSVRKSGNRLRITAQLIDARTDTHLWSETYDRSLDDVFAVQDEIADAVVGQLKVTLLGEAPKSRPTDPKAYALYLQANELSRQGSTDGLAQALALGRQAVEIDPKFVRAWCLIARVQSALADFGQVGNVEGYRLAREAAERAIAIDPNSATAHAALGGVLLATGASLAETARHYERALELEPANTFIMVEVMRFLRGLGRVDQVIQMGEYVVAHDPVNAFAHTSLGSAYSRAGRFDEGIASMRTALRLSPNRGLTHYAIGLALLAQGKPAAGLEEIQREPLETWRLDALAMAYHDLGNKAESDKALAQVIAKYEKESAWNIAYIYAYRGEADKCFEWLEKAVVYRDPGVFLTGVQRQFTNVHQDPRWLPFLRRLGIAPEQLAAIKFDVKLPAN
jgi:TolB-like protein/Tfp pilus assembly protein PilF